MFAFDLHRQPMCIYGDPAYPLRIHLQAPFRNLVLTPQMQAYNSAMSEVRSSVEWLFGEIIGYFKFLDFKKSLKIGLNSVGKMYVVCALLRNALTCLYGNQTSEFLSLTHLVCKITLPEKSVKIQHLLHFKSCRVECQKWCFFPNEKWNINSTVNSTCVFHNLSPFIL